MNMLKAGTSRVDITPMLGIPVRGYYKPRFADGVRDPLQITALALACGEEKVVMLSADLCGIRAAVSILIRQAIAEKTGLPLDAIWLHCTHTHTGPDVVPKDADPDPDGETPPPGKEADILLGEYFVTLQRRAVDAAVMALADLKPAKAGWAIGQAPNIAFVRRFRMKDGSVQTNPGVGNPYIVAPIGDVDERVNVVRIDREGGSTIVLVNFGDHPDTIGQQAISADWPGFLRRTVEKVLDNTQCIFFNGAQGDVNHVNVNAKDGDMNDLVNDFDDVARGYGHARHMGNVVAGAVLQVYDKVNYIDVDHITYGSKIMHIPTSVPTAEELVKAKEINALHEAGRDEDIPFKGMMLTTVVAEAARMIRLENGPDTFDMGLYGLAIGDLALSGIPGEPFTGVGRGLKEAKGWKLVMPCCLVNGSEAYFPMKDCYEEGGYEARSSIFKAGVAEQIIEEGLEVLDSLKK